MERFLRKTIETWEPLSDEPLIEEDARQMVENVTALFDLLDKWDREDKETRHDRH